MKRIIEKKVYNTETAELIAEWSNNLGRNDFNGMEQSLYKTKKGVYFLSYWGGANTVYSVSNGNMASEGSGIEVLTNGQAYNWLESRQFTEMIEEHFPDLIEEA